MHKTLVDLRFAFFPFSSESAVSGCGCCFFLLLLHLQFIPSQIIPLISLNQSYFLIFKILDSEKEINVVLKKITTYRDGKMGNNLIPPPNLFFHRRKRKGRKEGLCMRFLYSSLHFYTRNIYLELIVGSGFGLTFPNGTEG